MADFSQRSSPLDVLRKILEAYPFSAGIFKEIIQNSEDAQATKQVFILDRRIHPSSRLYHANLASTQGPALICFNDATFKACDWTALQNMYQSSKVSDSTKIGKFGIGFRSVFHLTDCPQILSGKSFALFDPLEAFTDSEGKKFSIDEVVKDFPDHIQSILPLSLSDLLENSDFKGTIIRCPLRINLTASSVGGIYGGISNEIVDPGRIATIMDDFVMQGLDDTALFLRNLQQITIVDIGESGVSTTIADITLTRHDPLLPNTNFSIRKVDTNISRLRGPNASETWVVASRGCPDNEASELLSRRVSPNTNVASTISRHKLNAMIALAVRVRRPSEVTGRLFTHLPLPIRTSFNTHINATFALTSDRQHLLNSEDGSVVPGSADDILRKWNELLFDHFIPQAWKEYLQYVVSTAANSESIYAAWPMCTTDGHWKNVPLKLFELAVANGMVIWPVYTAPDNHGTNLKALDARGVVIAGPSDAMSTIDALVALGVGVICLPQGIWSLLQSSSVKGVNLLNPTTAHAALLKKPTKFTSVPGHTLQIVLQYLISDGNVRNLVGLPIIPHASLGYLSLQTKDSRPFYTLLETTSSPLFSELDAAHNITLIKLPSDVASLLVKQGPGVLNVESISNDKVVFYLNTFLQRETSSTPSPRTVSWLLSFWEWLADWKDSSSLLRRVEDMKLIPCSDGLEPSSQPLFQPQVLDDRTINHLKELSLVFVHRNFYSWKLSSVYSPQDPTDLHSLVKALPSASALPTHLPRATAEGILRHIANYATASARLRGRFTESEIQKLRSLPLFSIVDRGESNCLLPIPASIKIQFIEDPPAYLPSIPGTVFVKLSPSISSQLASHLAPASDRISSGDLLDLALDHFSTQTPEVCLSVLRYVERRRLSIAPRIIKKLSEAPFLQVRGSTTKISPSAAVDPLSPLARLFENDHPRLPLKAGTQRARLDCLHNIGLMHRSLTAATLSERILYISEQHSSSLDGHRISQELLLCLHNRNTDFDLQTLDPGLANHQSLPWLPTYSGLASPESTWDASDTSTPRHLYDHVLRPLHVPYNTHLVPELKRFLGWDKPLPVTVIIRQFEYILGSDVNPGAPNHDRYDAITVIISELSRRTQLAPAEWKKLKVLTAGRRWVPTSNEQLVDIQDAIFDVPIPKSGFYRINAELNRDFMIKLGCVERPSTATIIHKLRVLGQQPTIEQITAGLRLLDRLPDEMSVDERNAVLIPDVTMTFRPLPRTKYDDVHAALGAPLSDELGEYFIAHPSLSDTLAYKLGLDRLGLEFATTLPGLSMGAKPLEQIQAILKDYDPRQFLIEFVANAVDAKAKHFSVMINEYVGNVQYSARVLSPSTMSELVKGPSLVIHNDSVFEDSDLTGICKTSVGSKAESSNTIGRFGLGSATMFYFCEVAMIISRGYVLFLNPSQRYLPKKETALLLSLNQVRIQYPDHLASLDRAFGLDVSPSATADYNGTLFVLPLRTHLSRSSHWTYNQTWVPLEIRQKVLKPFFEDMASNCLLFTGIEAIEIKERSQSGNEFFTWGCSATRQISQTVSTAPYSCHDVKIVTRWGDLREPSNTDWRVAQQLGLPVPDELLVGGYRFQNPAAAGIAARLPSTQEPRKHSTPECHYFSTLPLPIHTSLGVHIMASFYLSSDRRSIRLDNSKSGAGDTKYNRWLLRDIIPPLYLYLLENLATYGVTGNRSWWPKVARDAPSDYICEEMIESFYSAHLASSPRQVFNSVSSLSAALSPGEAVILQTGLPATVSHVLNHLKPYFLVSLGSQVTRLIEKHATTSLTYVTPEFLRDQICEQGPTFRHLLSPSTDKASHAAVYSALDVPRTNMLQEIYNYLSASNLQGLHILALSDNTFVAFEQASSTRQYYAWPTGSAAAGFRHNFSPQHFIHPQLDQSSITALNLNVVTLGAPEMVKLIGESISKQATFQDVPRVTANWISKFWQLWDCYRNVGLEVHHIQEFPLVRTISPDRYVSLKACEESGFAILIAEHSFSPNLGEALTALDRSVVLHSRKMVGTNVHSILGSSQYPYINLDKLARSLQGTNVLQKFGDRAQLHTSFADWARHLVVFSSHREGRIEGMARRLPIWPTMINSQTSLRSANDTYMLPQHVEMSLATHFINNPVSNYGSLQYLKGRKIEYQGIPGLLNLGGHKATNQSELEHFKAFIESWVNRILHPSQVSLYIPNLVGEFKLSSTLYARDQLFRDAFGNASPHFTSSIVWPLEERLEQYGLRRQSKLNFEMFLECANAIDEAVQAHDMDPNNSIALCDRAAAVFNVYATDVAIIAHKQGIRKEFLMSQLDNLAFIPRRTTSRRVPPQSSNEAGGIGLPENITRLAHVVKPSILVREEFEAVAWTQRACFKVQPDECILPIYDKLGKPSVLEVVMHLESLCNISKGTSLSAAQKATITEDVKSSYAFLTKRLPPANGPDQSANGDSLPGDISTRKIFLNINDPSDPQEMWTWRSAHQLIYTDKEDDQHIFGVKVFLEGYQPLLSHAGVLTEFQPVLPTNIHPSSSSVTDSTIRGRFNNFRTSQMFSDVVIEAVDDLGISVFLQAHRVFLAASSKDPAHFNVDNTQAPSNGLPVISPHRDDSDPELFSESSVNYLLNYTYSNEFRVTPDVLPLTTVLEALLLAHRWGFDDVFAMIEIQLIQLIKPRTLAEIRKMALRCNATTLIPACDQYSTQNKLYVDRVLGAF